jgi:hypothetical protein
MTETTPSVESQSFEITVSVNGDDLLIRGTHDMNPFTFFKTDPGSPISLDFLSAYGIDVGIPNVGNSAKQYHLFDYFSRNAPGAHTLHSMISEFIRSAIWL